MIAYYQRLTNMPDIVDYHWLGGLTERNVMINVIAIPQYTESEMSLSFNLFEGESNKPLYT
jgi:hypothetical protein